VRKIQLPGLGHVIKPHRPSRTTTRPTTRNSGLPAAAAGLQDEHQDRARASCGPRSKWPVGREAVRGEAGVFYPSKDGHARSPCSSSHAKGREEKDGTNPTLLYGLRRLSTVSLTSAVRPAQSSRGSRRGGVYAVPNLRGGRRVRQGRGTTPESSRTSRNVFDDFRGGRGRVPHSREVHVTQEASAIRGRQATAGLLVGRRDDPASRALRRPSSARGGRCST